ncbi:MAG: hypothetical protein HZC42_15315 [Candidatus Eisenbacteria bacterium]|nr:hypothetical protein [Candidatus Eisenbacteria bacterium]
MSRRILPIAVLSLACLLPNSGHAGKNAAGTVRLSWDPAGAVTDRTKVPAGVFPLYLHLDSAPDVRALAVHLRWFPFDSRTKCYSSVSAAGNTACGWATAVPPNGDFEGDSSYTGSIVFSPLSSGRDCVEYWFSAATCGEPSPADFVLASVKVKDSAGSVDSLTVLNRATILGGSKMAVTVESVHPGEVLAGHEVAVTVSGRNFTPGAAVEFDAPGIHVAVSPVKVVDERTILATLLAPDAPGTVLSAAVILPDGGSGTLDQALRLVALPPLLPASGDDVPLPAPTYVTEWGTQGSGAGAFQYIKGVSCGPESLIYVCDWGNGRVQVFREGGALERTIPFETSAEGYSLGPSDASVDRGDTLYVLDTGGIVQMFGPDGNRIAEWKTTDFVPPGNIPGGYLGGIEASPNFIYVTTSRLSNNPPHQNGGIVQLTKDGQVLREIPVWDSSDEYIGQQQGLATDRFDNVYDVINFTVGFNGPRQTVIKKYDKNGFKLKAWTMPVGDYRGLFVDPSGVVYFTTAQGHVRVLADSVETNCDFSGADSPRGPATSLYGLAGDSLGALYVTDRSASLERVMRARIDIDDDGLNDAWEKYGIEVDANGRRWIPDSPQVFKKDLYVEVDCLAGRTFGPAAVELVRNAFANVSSWSLPSPNPGFVNGVELHAQVDETGLADPGFAGDVLGSFRTFKGSRFGTLAERDSGFTAAKRMVTRYCVFAADNATGGSGLAELVGDDFLVSIAQFDSAGVSPIRHQAAAFMHELGHNLGLWHGGQDDWNHKPNYHSIMNYTWQFPVPEKRDWERGWRLDYNRDSLQTLLENGLVDDDGIWDGSEQLRFKVPFGPAECDGDFVVMKGWATNTGRVDWNRDGFWGLCFDCDINRFAGRRVPGGPCVVDDPSAGQALRSYRDWNKIRFLPRLDPHWRVDAHDEMLSAPGAQELTFSEYQAWALSPIDCNGNGIEDNVDIEQGTSLDVDRNLIPDECDPPRLSGVTARILACPGADAESLAWRLDVTDVYGTNIYDPAVPIYAVLRGTDPGVRAWDARQRTLGDGDTLWAASYDPDSALAKFRVGRWSGCGTFRCDLYVDDTLVVRQAMTQVVSLDLNGYGLGSVDHLDRATWSEWHTSGCPSCPACGDFDGDGALAESDSLALDQHLGHHVPRQLLTPNGGEVWVVGTPDTIRWVAGAGDSARASLYLLRDSDVAYRARIARDVPDTGRLVWTPGTSVATGTDFRVEVVHTVGVMDTVTNESVGSDVSDATFTLSGGTVDVRAVDGPRPLTFALGPSRPNPFGGSAAIGFDLPITSDVRMVVFDLQGRAVRHLVAGRYGPGRWTVEWNGSDDQGRALPPAAYLYRVEAGPFRAHRKAVLLK